MAGKQGAPEDVRMVWRMLTLGTNTHGAVIDIQCCKNRRGLRNASLRREVPRFQPKTDLQQERNAGAHLNPGFAARGTRSLAALLYNEQGSGAGENPRLVPTSVAHPVNV